MLLLGSRLEASDSGSPRLRPPPDGGAALGFRHDLRLGLHGDGGTDVASDLPRGSPLATGAEEGTSARPGAAHLQHLRKLWSRYATDSPRPIIRRASWHAGSQCVASLAVMSGPPKSTQTANLWSHAAGATTSVQPRAGPARQSLRPKPPARGVRESDVGTACVWARPRRCIPTRQSRSARGRGRSDHSPRSWFRSRWKCSNPDRS